MPMHCILRNVFGIVFYTFLVIIFYALRFKNRVLSYYIFPPVARRRNAQRAKY
ncbi:hypothetical protein Hanom_Chr16g01502331 [Helianthus anomalus]